LVSPEVVLSDRALNRATLARQALLEREATTPADLIERFAGVQAQEPVVPYITLWSRLARFAPEDLQALLASGAVVRVPLWRNTIHHVTRADFERFWATSRRGGNYKVRGSVEGLDAEAIVTAAREALPMTLPALGRALAERFPGHDPFRLSMVARRELPLVHLPPAGFWQRGGAVHNDVADGCSAEQADAALVLRYLRGFGPASVMDAQYFAGVTRLKPAFEALRDQLVTFRNERGVELFDLPDAPRPAADTPAPPRLLGVFDNALIGYADRARVLAPHYDGRIVGPEAPVLIDGFAAATWTLKRGEPLTLRGSVGADALAEAERLAAFLGAPGVRQAS
jgi:hypothetical protein